MSPLQDELRTTFREHAATVDAPPDPFALVESRASQLRRHRWLGAGTAGVAIALVAVGITVALSGGDDTTARVRVPAASNAPTPSDTVKGGPAPVNVLQHWPERADTTDPSVLAQSTSALAQQWGKTHHAPDNLSHLLWAGRLPDGRRAVAMQMWEMNSTADAWTVFGVTPAAGDDTVIAADRPTWFTDQDPGEPVSATKDDASRIAEISTVIDGTGAGQAVVLVIAKHVDDTVAFGPDAQHTAEVPSADGVAVFAPDASVDPAHGVLVVRDSSGAVTYQGPIDGE